MSKPSFLQASALAAALFASAGAFPNRVLASDTPDPSSVAVAGDFQQELGCPADWQPECPLTDLLYDSEDDVWQAVFAIPAGNWQYKAPLNDSWTENYGDHALRDGPNILLNLADAQDVKFYYDHKTHWITSNFNALIAVAPGDFQSELGCASDWDPSCLRSWLQDPDGDGVFTFRTAALPAGNYEVKVAINESWDLNFGAGGVQNGPNIPFTVPSDCVEMLFSFDDATKILSVGLAPASSHPDFVTIAGSFQEELGCPGDWLPDCALTHLALAGEDGVWQGTFGLPGGFWEYKAPLNNSWDLNYGLNATQNGPNIPLNLDFPESVKFYYEHGTHWVTDNRNTAIAVAPGSFQSEIGCNGDWDPSCLRSWLQDPDGDGISTFSVRLPAGDYEAKVAINESWDLNYGLAGVQNGPNIPFSVAEACSEVFFSYEEGTHILTIGQANAPKGSLQTAKAYWVAEDTVLWSVGSPGDVIRLHYDSDAGLTLDSAGLSGGQSVELTLDPTGPPAAVLAKLPHLSGLKAYKIAAGDLALVPQILKGQTAVSAADPQGDPIDATALQIPGVLDDLFSYEGDLGVSFDGSVPTLRVWAPTAQAVQLLLFDDSDPATQPAAMAMSEDASSGVWSVSGSADWNRKFYLYEVQVYAPGTRRIETNQVTDPYSLSLSMDSKRSQIVRLEDADLKPSGWDSLHKPPLAAPEDAVIWEVQVRDFSSGDSTVPAGWRGTFKAFAAAGSNGMQHLSRLAQAGLTHVHILPAFDFATVPENPSDRQEPGDLSGYPPDSDQQQAAVAAVRDLDAFNWGYDPFHYTVPEGSYSTDPDGPVRIREFREMVQALNQAGLRVVMDVVYNHTTAHGQNPKAVLDRIVPGYYHRLNSEGGVENSSCCSNTASEHNMMEKLLIDSVLSWARDYKVDGFRFDLMGHHMKSNMLRLRSRLDALNQAQDGVDGPSIYLYGEGWNFGEVANNARGVNATQSNMRGTGIGTFNDRIRDGIRGGNPFSDLREQGFVNGLFYDSNGHPQGDEKGNLLHRSDWIRIGLAGNLADYQLITSSGSLLRADQVDYFGQQAGYTADPQEIINYAAAHDNETLFDAIQLKAPLASSMDDRVRMQNMANSLVLLGQGVPFFHAGQDLLRSKSMDRDSFNSGDWFNQIDFTLQANGWGRGLPSAEKNQDNWPIMQPRLADPALNPGAAHILRARQHFEEMLQIRNSTPLFRLGTGQQIRDRVRFHNTGPDQVAGLIVMSISDEDGGVDRRIEQLVALFNASDDPVVFPLAGASGKAFGLHEVQAASSDPVVRTSSFESAAGSFSVPARTTAVFVQKRSAQEQIGLLIGDVDDLESQGVLNNGQANALRSLLAAALSSVEDGNPNAAQGQMNAFQNQVQALMQAGILSEGQGQSLLAAAQDVADCL